MTFYDYKVVPAPRHLKKARGITDPAELLSLTLGELLTEQARSGWEFIRAETLHAEAPRSMFRRAVEEAVTVLVFRRERESLEPRLAAAPQAAAPVTPAPATPPTAAAARPEPAVAAPDRPEPDLAAARPFSERVREAGRMRREPTLGDTPPDPRSGSDAAPQPQPSPLRPTPSLGPADRS